MDSYIEKLELEWAHQRPDLDAQTIATTMRLQLLNKSLTDAASEAVAAKDLEWWEYDTLSALLRSGQPYQMYASDLARSNMLSTGAMTNRLDGLEDRGLIQRKADRADRRRTIIQLTLAGRKLVEKAAGSRFQSADAILQNLDDGERRQLDQLLDKLLSRDKRKD
ncbi:MAG: MarR family transcriptional regulator [Xanthomonadales bacterium]|nr:MarR family transcriptional regulator [Xanthomonadales bacterium]